MADIKIVSKKQPTVEEMEDMFFGFGVVKYVKSNAIVVVKNKQAIGIGAGQMSRVDASDIALNKASKFGSGGILASDAFFPFRDSIDLAAKYGITAIIEPGGSKRDEEVIAAADEHGIALAFTGRRHFCH
jgi:phosphoribosylaminoimidazolecarboxamide formyltransferase/IMP cyclohydrolase